MKINNHTDKVKELIEIKNKMEENEEQNYIPFTDSYKE